MWYKNRPMIAYIHIVIGVFCVAQCSFSQSLNCMKLTTSCPNKAQWLDKEKTFNCAGNKRYICLMTPGDKLHEGCIFNIRIPAGRTGCPCTMECDIRTGQLVLVTPDNFLPCPPDLDGCPPRNHSGYSILEIYRYARCQGRNLSGESYVSPDEDTGTQTTNIPLETPKLVNWTINIISIVVGFILIFFLVILIVHRRTMSKHSETNTPNTFSPDENEMLPLLSAQRHDNDQYDHTFFYPGTPLHEAASKGHIDIVRKLIDSNADVNANDCFWGTPLHQAVSNGYSDIVRILIDSNADVNAIDWYQDTPLIKAASDGHIDIVKELINAKADVNAKSYCQDTPLHMAALNGHIEIVKALINAKADVNAKSWDTPLHMAAINGHSDTVSVLIDAEADVHAKGCNNETPLHKAVTNGHSDVVKILIDSVADVNAKCRNGKTPLHLAVESDQSDIIKILLDAYADVNAQDKNGKTPLHLAVEFNQCDIIKILHNADADINALDKNNKTPLSLAEDRGIPDIFKAIPHANVTANENVKA